MVERLVLKELDDDELCELPALLKLLELQQLRELDDDELCELPTLLELLELQHLSDKPNFFCCYTYIARPYTYVFTVVYIHACVCV